MFFSNPFLLSVCNPACTLTLRHAANASGLSWNAGDMDFTGGQMVLTLKLIAMAVSYQDTHEKKEEVRPRALEGAGEDAGAPAVVAHAAPACVERLGLRNNSSTALA
jgi:hypothetical protein